MKSAFLTIAFFLSCVVAVKANSTKINEKESLNLSFSSHGEQYLIQKAPSDFLQLKRVGCDEILMEVKAKQYEWGRIKKLILHRNNWLWIDGEETDYIAYLDKNSNPPIIHQPIMLPDLYDNKCHLLDRLFGSCIRAQGVYDSAKESITVRGYPKSVFGFNKKVTYQVIEGNAILLPRKNNGH